MTKPRYFAGFCDPDTGAVTGQGFATREACMHGNLPSTGNAGTDSWRYSSDTGELFFWFVDEIGTSSEESVKAWLRKRGYSVSKVSGIDNFDFQGSGFHRSHGYYFKGRDRDVVKDPNFSGRAAFVGDSVTRESIDELFEKGAWKSLAAAGLMGAAALTGRSSDTKAIDPADRPVTMANYHPNSTMTARPKKLDKPDPHEAVEYQIKIWDTTHSMGYQWANKTVTMRSVGPGVGQVPYNALKVGMVVARWTTWTNKIRGYNYNQVFHRIIKITPKGIYTEGDNNKSIDPGLAQPSDIIAVCVEVAGVDPNDSTFNLVIPEYNKRPADDLQPKGGELAAESALVMTFLRSTANRTSALSQFLT